MTVCCWHTVVNCNDTLYWRQGWRLVMCKRKTGSGEQRIPGAHQYDSQWQQRKHCQCKRIELIIICRLITRSVGVYDRIWVGLDKYKVSQWAMPVENQWCRTWCIIYVAGCGDQWCQMRHCLMILVKYISHCQMTDKLSAKPTVVGQFLTADISCYTTTVIGRFLRLLATLNKHWLIECLHIVINYDFCGLQVLSLGCTFTLRYLSLITYLPLVYTSNCLLPHML